MFLYLFLCKVLGSLPAFSKLGAIEWCWKELVGKVCELVFCAWPQIHKFACLTKVQVVYYYGPIAAPVNYWFSWVLVLWRTMAQLVSTLPWVTFLAFWFQIHHPYRFRSFRGNVLRYNSSRGCFPWSEMPLEWIIKNRQIRQADCKVFEGRLQRRFLRKGAESGPSSV